MPQAVDPSLLRRLAVLVALLALVLSAAPAFAQTGGTVAQQVPEPAKKVTTKQIQKALGIRADGAFGPQTKRALKRFQRANNLRVTGRPNTATLRALGLLDAPQAGTLDAAPSGDTKAILDKIAECESGGDPTAESANGRYFGKYQFSIATWESLGGTGNPAEADEATQDAMALKLYELRGTAPWPSCG